MWSQIDLRQIAISIQKGTPGKRVNFDDANYRIWVALKAGYFGGEGKKMWGDVRGGWKKVINFAIYSV